ncbi:NADP-dependent oxidoreductase [Kribbella sp. NPDC055071]
MSSAVVFDRYGAPEVLHVVEVETPVPGPRQILVRVRAAGIQPFDNYYRSGEMAGFVPAEFPQQLGNELAGVVEAVGDCVTGVRLGDEVLGWVDRMAFAQYAVMPVDQFVLKPKELAWPEAGGLAGAGMTAHTALQAVELKRGEKLLVHAASGGVGSMAVQMARAIGATVIGTASEHNHDYLHSLGADAVIYGDGLTEGLLQLAPGGVDAVIDAAATDESLRASIDLVQDRDRAVTVGINPLADELGIRQVAVDRSTQRLNELTRLVEAGSLHVNIHKTFPLDQTAAGQHIVEAGHVRGKVVITID